MSGTEEHSGVDLARVPLQAAKQASNKRGDNPVKSTGARHRMKTVRCDSGRDPVPFGTAVIGLTAAATPQPDSGRPGSPHGPPAAGPGSAGVPSSPYRPSPDNALGKRPDPGPSEELRGERDNVTPAGHEVKRAA